jgi:hypothetical protein
MHGFLTQVWEYDKGKVQQDAIGYIAAYKYEIGTIMCVLDMNSFIKERPPPPQRAENSSGRGQAAAGGGGEGLRSGAALPPKPGQARGTSAAGVVQHLFGRFGGGSGGGSGSGGQKQQRQGMEGTGEWMLAMHRMITELFD